MMSRTQITLDPEIQRRARRRASDLGISLAEYVRRVVARDLGGTTAPVDPSVVFDLGSSGGSNIAKDKDAMIAEAFAAGRRMPHRR
jgi:hypothetical protein